MAPLRIVLVCVVVSAARAGGACGLRCHDDFNSIGVRRGSGGGAYGWLPNTVLRSGTAVAWAAPPLPALAVAGNADWNHPSTGWRVVTELPHLMQDGTANYWLGSRAAAFNADATNARLPELLTRRRNWATAQTNAWDVGAMYFRADGAFGATATPKIVPDQPGMCAGAYAGTMVVADKFGLVADFASLSVKFAAFAPQQQAYASAGFAGGVLGGAAVSSAGLTGYVPASGGVGLVFNSQTHASSVPYQGYQVRGYVAIFRGQPGGVEICAGVYKLLGDNGCGTAPVPPCTPSQNVLPLGSVTIPALAGFNNTNALGNPVLTATSAAARRFTRVGASKAGATIRLWVDSPANVVLTVTDTNSPLAAGHVGIASIGLLAAALDDFELADAPTCADGLWNGDEAGVDCGGSCAAACPTTTQTFSHRFQPPAAAAGLATGALTQGQNPDVTGAASSMTGWHAEVYGTASGAHVGVPFCGAPSYGGVTPPISGDARITAGTEAAPFGPTPSTGLQGTPANPGCGFQTPVNTGGNWPGQPGTTYNSDAWLMGAFHFASKWAPAKDVDLTYTMLPYDNDWTGVIWRYVDHNNYYCFIFREEVTTVPYALHRRRNGVNTILDYYVYADVPVRGGNNGRPGTCGTATDPVTGLPLVPCGPYNSQPAILEVPGSRANNNAALVGSTFRVTMTGSVIRIFTSYPNNDVNLADPLAGSTTLYAQAVDPDPLDAAGWTGFLSSNHQNTINYGFKGSFPYRAPDALPDLGPRLRGLTPATQAAIAFYADALGLLPAAQFSPWRAAAGRGVDLHNAPAIYGAATQPAAVAGVVGYGSALRFSGGQFLLASLSTAADVGIAGLTLAIALLPAGGVPAAGSPQVVLAKGLRERPWADVASGWRLQVVNPADRPGAGAAAGQAVLHFTARVGGLGAADNTIDVSTPIDVTGAPACVVVRVARTAGAGVTSLAANVFNVTALLNGAPFVDAADASFIGTQGTGMDQYLALGATDMLTDAANVNVFELAIVSAGVPDADVATLSAALTGRYRSAAATCPDLTASQPNAVPDASVAGNNCAAAGEGGTCTLACVAPATATVGGGALTCRGGAWTGTMIKCDTSCASVSVGAAGDAGCFAARAYESWAVPGLLGLGGAPAYRHWTTESAANLAWSVAAPGALSLIRPGSYKYPAVLQATVAAPAWATPTATGRARVVQSVTLPAVIVPPLLVSFLVRYRDAANYYAIDFFFDVGFPVVPPGRVQLRRLLAGGPAPAFGAPASALPGTVLCSSNPAVLAPAPGGTYEFATLLDANTNFITSFVGPYPYTTAWCSTQEASANWVATGTAGFAVTGANFTALSFGRFAVEDAPASCPRGCAGTVVNGTCTLACNAGVTARGGGSAVRTCGPDGSFSGPDLVCDAGQPLLSSVALSLPELSPAGTPVGAPFPAVLSSGVVATGSIIFEITAGNANGAFAMDACGGQISVAAPALIDYEAGIFAGAAPGAASAYVLTVRAYVPGTAPVAEAFATVTLTVTDANDPPALTTTACAVAENSPAGAAVCTLAVVDPDNHAGGNPAFFGSNAFSFAYEEVPERFALNAGTGALTVGDVLRFGPLNFEGPLGPRADGLPRDLNAWRVVVVVADRNAAGVASSGAVLISLTDVPEPPIIVQPCAVDASAAVWAARQIIPGFNLGACVFDPDAGASFTVTPTFAAASCPPRACSPLTDVGSSGAAATSVVKSFAAATPFLLDARVVLDYGETPVQVTDNTGLPGFGVVRTYVRAAVAGLAPVDVVPVDSASGSGVFGGAVLINTNGGDRVRFTGDAIEYNAADVLSATAAASDAPARNWTVACQYEYTGRVSGSTPLADAVLCNTRPGWGVGWRWAVSYTRAGTTTPFFITGTGGASYAPPLVTGLGDPTCGQGVGTCALAYPTAGGTPIGFLGANFGPAGAPVQVDLGTVDAASGAFTPVFSDAVAGLAPGGVVASNPPLKGTMRPGAGAGWRVRVTVGGQSALAPPAQAFSYLPPAITAIALKAGTVSGGGQFGTAVPLPGSPWYAGQAAISGANTFQAGDVVTINGTNFGPYVAGLATAAAPAAGAPVALSFDLPARPDNNLYWTVFCSYPSAALSHTQIECVLPGAPGAAYTAVVTVAGQRSARTSNATAARTVRYRTAWVSTITGPGGRGADTRGGSFVFLTGTNFGSKSSHDVGYCPPPRVYFGCFNRPANAGPRGTGCVYTLTANQTVFEFQIGNDPAYNNNPIGMEYEATGCTVQDEAGTTMFCQMPPGQGYANFAATSFFYWTVIPCGNPIGGWAAALAAIRYGAPVVTGFDTALVGATGAATAGGDAVRITGYNFGPGMLLTSARYYAAVTDASGARLTVGFDAVGCFKPDAANAHTLLQCSTSPGAGAGLRWEVTVSDQPSIQPTSAYGPPAVVAVGAAYYTTGGTLCTNALPVLCTTTIPPAVLRNPLVGPANSVTAVSAASSEGGTVIYIEGSNFGPAGAGGAGAPFVQWVRFGPSGGGGGAALVYDAYAFSFVTPHTLLAVTLPPGIGTNLAVQLMVGDQASTTTAPTAGLSISYAPPTVTAVAPAAGLPTAGGAVVRVSARGVGLLDPTSVQALTLNGASVPIVDQFPTPDRVAAAAGDVRLLSAAERDPAQQFIAFLLPPGAGTRLAVRVRAYREAAPTSSVASGAGAASELSYAPAAVSFVASDRCDTPAALNATVALLCPGWAPGAPYCAAASPAALDGYRYITIVGASFGPGPAQGVVSLQLQAVDPATRAPVAGAVFRSDSVALVAVTSWADGKVVALVKYASAAVRFATTAYDGNAGVLATPNYSPAFTYLDVSPAVSAVTGGPPGGFSTAGGQTVTLYVANVQAFLTLSVTIGNASAPILASAADPASVLPPGSVFAAVIQPQLAAFTAAGTPPSAQLYAVPVLVPAGQGSAAAVSTIVTVTRDGTPGTGGHVSYAPPVITLIGLNGTGALADATSFSAVVCKTCPGPFRVPTAGAVVALAGTNLGTCPVVRFGLARGAACAGDALAGDALTVLAFSHTALLVAVPPGVGAGSASSPPGLPFVVVAGDQASLPVVAAYGLPAISSTAAADPAVGLPTSGGFTVVVNGANFGAMGAATPLVSVLVDNATAPCTNVTRTVAHSQLTCVVPAGGGAGLTVVVQVADQTARLDGAFSYDAPAIAAIRARDPADAAGYGSAVGNTPGGYVVELFGVNFGANPAGPGARPAMPPPTGCVFVADASVNAPFALGCDALVASFDEGQLNASAILAWNHTYIAMLMPPGFGRRAVVVSARGQASSPTAGAAAFTYNPPNVTALSVGVCDCLTYYPARCVLKNTAPLTSCAPTGSTDGYELVTLVGTNFGTGSTRAQNARRLAPGYAPLAFPLSFPAFQAALGASFGGGAPSGFALRVNFFSATACVSSAVATDSISNAPPPGVAACVGAAPGALAGVLTHTHTTLVFTSLPGVGAGKALSLAVVGPDGAVVASAPVPWSYSPPSVLYVDPTPVRVTAPTLLGAGLWTVPATTLTVHGANFGTYGLDAAWSAADRALALNVSGRPCAATARAQVPVDRAPLPPAAETVITCSWGADASFGVPVASSAIPKAGVRALALSVGGQLAPAAQLSALQVVCARGFYAQLGEACDACPANAACAGYSAATAAAGGAAAAPVVLQTWVNGDGLNVTECASCYAQPTALAGYYNMRGLVDGAGKSDTTCSPLRAAEGLRAAKDCDSIVACDPPEACLAGNACAAGYASPAWPFRCSTCADGYFRSAGNCRACPTNPALNIVFFFLVAVAAIFLGWFLNQKQVNIAFLTIGLDYIQVIAIFASTRVAWPQQIKDLFRILSAFNLNIEIIAPECAFKGITYAQKWFMIMALPLAVAGVLLFIHANAQFWLYVIKNQRAAARESVAPLLAMAQVLMYFLYLYLTRTVFDIFTCRSAIPAEFDVNGVEILYLAGVVERCNVPAGVNPDGTQARLILPAVVGLVVYVLGYPGFIGYNLFRNRELVMEDQLLRAKRSGDDALTGPHTLAFRRRWARAYYQFRPDMCLWVLVILLRKFCISIASLIFNTNQNFQMAAMLLVLFVAYAAQVRFRPYMGPATFDAVLAAHVEAARAGDATHLRLAATIAGITAKGRKAARVNTFGGAKRLSAAAVAGSVAAFLFDYNTVEASMIASALLTALAGVMFGAAATNTTSAFYQQSRDGVMVSVLALIAVSIIYWLTVVCAEVYFMIREGGDEKRRAAAAERAAKGKAPAGDERGARRGSRGKSGGAEPFNAGDVESTASPLFVVGGGARGGEDPASPAAARGGAAYGFDTDAVRGMTAAPPQAVWDVLRASYLDAVDGLDAAAAEEAALRARLDALRAELGEDAGAAAAARAGGGRAASAAAAAAAGGAAAKAKAARAAAAAGGGRDGGDGADDGGGGASPSSPRSPRN